MKVFIQSIQIIGLAKEDPYFVRLKLTFKSGEVKYIKFSLDKFTYNHLIKVVSPGLTDNRMNGITCSIPVNLSGIDNSSPETEWILFHACGQINRFSYLCSPAYKLLLHKLRGIGSLEELGEIFIKKNASPDEPSRYITPKTPRKLFKLILITLTLTGFMFYTSQTTLLGGQQSALVVGNEAKIVMADIVQAAPEQVTLNEAEPVNVETPDEKTSNFQQMISSLPDGQVALTFDDGPSAYTQDILSVLNEYGIKATFFFVGKNISRYPLSVSDAKDQGHVIGLHSFFHQELRDLSYQQQKEDIISCLEEIKPYISQVSFFRPPYGMYNENTKKVLLEHQMALVLWNRDPKDWDANFSHEIVEAVLESSPSGGIYVLHENKLTLEALPQIIEGVQEQGLELVALGNDASVAD
ncbi:MAG: polysaccharide deacetylase family protein [Bacillota bacterium]|jgi:peptidoglycan/xylan/chitin deacetylase (PgdA/CDA1 family)